MLILSALSFALGFVALLCTKIYVFDKGTNQATEVQMPLIGKMKTNYPALVFVAVGAVLAADALKQHYQFVSQQQPVLWNIKGRLQQPAHDIKDWRWGELRLIALGPNVQIKQNGEYEINVQIPAGKTFESAVQQIYYTARNGSALVVPSDELKTFTQNRPKSLLLAATDNTRVYGPRLVTILPDNGASQ